MALRAGSVAAEMGPHFAESELEKADFLAPMDRTCTSMARGKIPQRAIGSPKIGAANPYERLLRSFRAEFCKSVTTTPPILSPSAVPFGRAPERFPNVGPLDLTRCCIAGVNLATQELVLTRDGCGKPAKRKQLGHYLDYLDKVPFGNPALNVKDLLDQKTSPSTPKSLIYN